jgi:hypothetical protein
MANPGLRLNTYCNIATEVTSGTPVAPTRTLQMQADGLLDVDFSLNFHENENRGVRTRIARTPTQQAEDVNLSLSTITGIGYDELPILFAVLNGTATAVGGSADKTWTQSPNMGTTNSPKSFTLDIGDDVQNWRTQYSQWSTIKLSSALGSLTQLEASGFAQRAIKTSKSTSAASTAPIMIPGDLWTIKFASTQGGLTGASIVSNFLVDWELEIDTGLRWRHYMDGNLYGGQSVESADISGNLMMTVESTAQTISQFYDKYATPQLDFIRLKATGPTLGSSNYSSQIDLPVFYDKPQILAALDDGVNLYKIPARLAYDSTTSKSIQLVTVAALTALP